MSRVIGRCSAGHIVKGVSEDVRMGWIVCACGRRAVAKYMSVTVRPEKKCNGVCMGAVGPSCDCSCGGENHGSRLVFAS